MRYGCCILITPLDLLLNQGFGQVHSLLGLFVASRINDRLLPMGIGVVRDPTFIKIMDPKAGLLLPPPNYSRLARSTRAGEKQQYPCPSCQIVSRNILLRDRVSRQDSQLCFS